MEGRAERLEVPEDAATDLVEHVLPDPALHHQEAVARESLGQRRQQHDGDHGEQRLEVVALPDRRDAGVDADLDEVGDRQACDVLDEDDRHQHPQRLAVRRQQLAQQPARAAAEPDAAAGEPLGRLVGVGLRLASPVALLTGLLTCLLVGAHAPTSAVADSCPASSAASRSR